jgi:hypothetical protein
MTVSHWPTPSHGVPVISGYYPCPLFLVPSAVSAPASPVAPVYARPTPAPPSAAPAPTGEGTRFPGKGPTPRVTESRSAVASYSVVPRSSEKLAGERCSVGFWNLTNRDLTLKVEGNSRVIPRGKSVTLELGRQFVWQIEGREPQTEQVPPTEAGVEIVIRM